MILFIHIPKTAGTTMQSIFKRHFEKKSCLFINRFKDFRSLKNIKEHSPSKLNLVQAHMPFGIHNYLKFEKRYITFLQNPVNRVISLYHSIYQSPNHYLYKEVVKYKMTLKDFIDSKITVEIENGQVRLLSGSDLNTPIYQINENHYQTAKTNLDKYFFSVGICEKFDDSLLLLANKLDRKSVPYYYSRNVGNYLHNQKVPCHIIDQIKELNSYDIKLYERAVNKFDLTLKRTIPDYKKILKSFQKQNNIYQKLVSPYFFSRSLAKKILARKNS